MASPSSVGTTILDLQALIEYEPNIHIRISNQCRWKNDFLVGANENTDILLSPSGLFG